MPLLSRRRRNTFIVFVIFINSVQGEIAQGENTIGREEGRREKWKWLKYGEQEKKKGRRKEGNCASLGKGNWERVDRRD